MILSSEERVLDYSRDEFAVPYGDMHPILQRYYNRLGEVRRYPNRDPRYTLARLIRHAKLGQVNFVRDFCSGDRTASGPRDLYEQCSKANIVHDEIAEDIIRYCNIKICENDIEFYTMGGIQNYNPPQPP